MKPYVGITGFMRREEVRAVLDVLPSSDHRVLMVGVLASSKTLAGKANKWPNRYPKVEDIKNIFLDDTRTLNLVHYNTDNPADLVDQLLLITQLAGPHIHGIQLNITWPEPQMIQRFSTIYPYMRVVLQVGNKAFGVIEHSPRLLAQKLKREYDGIVDYLLLDTSGGLGRPIQVRRSLQYLEELKSKQVNIRLGLAGGLCAETLLAIQPLIDEFSGLSIDAEGKLRDADDHLKIESAKEYVVRAFSSFQKSDAENGAACHA